MPSPLLPSSSSSLGSGRPGVVPPPLPAAAAAAAAASPPTVAAASAVAAAAPPPAAPPSQLPPPHADAACPECSFPALPHARSRCRPLIRRRGRLVGCVLQAPAEMAEMEMPQRSHPPSATRQSGAAIAEALSFLPS
jgi:hypothetical protein